MKKQKTFSISENNIKLLNQKSKELGLSMNTIVDNILTASLPQLVGITLKYGEKEKEIPTYEELISLTPNFKYPYNKDRYDKLEDAAKIKLYTIAKNIKENDELRGRKD